MPLRDHFRPPVSRRHSWEGFFGGWPAVAGQQLVRRLPPGYSAEPRVHLGAYRAEDEGDDPDEPPPVVVPAGPVVPAPEPRPGSWAPPPPAQAGPTDLSEEYEYGVRIYEEDYARRLVAVVGFVSPGNKNRAVGRRAFVAKYAHLLRKGVSVGVVDVVTTGQQNLYHDFRGEVGCPVSAAERPGLYAAACRVVPSYHPGLRGRFEAWEYPLAAGRPLPVLPLWLDHDLAVPLELEESYEETCRVLGIS
ncbi:MAG: hypothetical protein K2X87_29200 [Gemmataceae bacterium]|nr:hypothetical protein [Gemmataceae bacterium]